ncbi:N-6 DNA methylase, partial [Campylobacter vulpis]
MITKENLKEVLEILGFETLSTGGKKLDSKKAHIYTKTINTYIMQVDFTNQKLIYPQGVKIHDTTTSNFSHPENFVVFECVHRLLEKGYKAESLELEPKWQLGREAKSGKADILVRDNKNAPYLIIECKTAGENSKSEFSKEWERMQNNGGQLFSYFQQEKATKFLCLYTSDLEAESKSIKYQNYIIQAFDNDEYLQENELENSYKKASNNTELFAVWKESYKLQFFTQGIFENDVNAYRILETILTFDKLQELKEEGKYHEFAKILRKHNISGKENAFDKLVNIFLCKIYDESFNKNNLKFGYFGVMADTYANMQDRLMLLYKEAMKEFLGEEITFVSNDDIEKAFKKLHATDLKAQIQKHIKELKFYSNNDFAFLEVHNKELFLQNAIVLKEIIELFAPYKLTQNSTNQFLGNLFELFLQKGMKQDEGQFFTPIQICEFIMYSLPLDSMTKASKPLKVLDFACGAGHFLNTYANEIKRYITQDLQEHYKQIYGIEKEYRLSKVAKVSSAMYGQNEINILYADALATHELENPKTDKGNKQKPQINNHSFDLLIANPPYSVKGFLETLSAKSKKTYTLFTNDINIETNNAIECFFIERANQLLRDNAKAAIILPSSILNKDGLYKSTREILLINFDFIAIVELGSQTFGATGTNTIILFLRKKDSFTPENTTISQDYSHIKNYIESGHLSQNKPYKDYINAFNAYCDSRGFDKKDYESFLNGSLESQPNGRTAGFRAQKDLESSCNLSKMPSETKDTEQNIKNAKSTTQLLELDAFKEYHAAFKETSEYKKLLDSKAYKDSKDKDTLAHNAFLAYARAIEKDKLLYFSLSLNQAPVIIKAPSDNKEQKRFLGYEWSNRKGDEGLKELHSPYLSPLFERDNPHNPNKLAYLVRQAFVSTDMGG